MREGILSDRFVAKATLSGRFLSRTGRLTGSDPGKRGSDPEKRYVSLTGRGNVGARRARLVRAEVLS